MIKNIVTIFLILINSFFVSAIFSQKVEFDNTVEDLENKVSINRASGNISNAVVYLSKIAFMYWDAGNLEKAVEYFLSAEEISSVDLNPKDLQKIYTNLAVIYTDYAKLDKAREYFIKSLEIRKLIGNKADISAGMNDVAYIMIVQRNFEPAIKLLDESLQIANSIDNNSLQLSCFDLLAMCYKGIGNKKLNEEFQFKYNSLKITIETNLKKELEKEKEAKQFVEADKSKAELQEKELRLMLATLRSKAVEDSMKRETQRARDSVEVVRKQKEIAEKLTLKQQELTNALSLKREAERKRQELLLYGAAVVFIMFILLLGVGFWSYMNKRKDNKILEKHNAEIQHQAEELNKKNLELSVALKQNEYQTKNIEKSISYASRIQLSLLPEMDKLQSLLPESFIFFQPRDVVSGDFYWFKETSNTKVDTVNFSDIDDMTGNLKLVEEKAIIVSAVDCSGHGVPGALLSMIGINHLEDIVNHKRIIEPGEILNNLHIGIRNSLKQETNMGRDGMDIALCTIYTESDIVEFAGAKNPAIYVKNGELHRVKGELYSIGGFQLSEEQLYTTHRITIDQPVMFYVFSDGFGDQFGGPAGKKFMTNNFRDLLLSISDLPINEQQAKLENTFDEWKGGLEQVDDVLVIGFKVYPRNYFN